MKRRAFLKSVAAMLPFGMSAKLLANTANPQPTVPDAYTFTVPVPEDTTYTMRVYCRVHESHRAEWRKDVKKHMRSNGRSMCSHVQARFRPDGRVTGVALMPNGYDFIVRIAMHTEKE
jgi:hypothetical protein